MRMGILFACIAVAIFPGAACADEVVQRYGINADYKTYPQSTAKETLASFLKAVEDKHLNYALAHLADPHWVEKRVKDVGGKFEDLVKECRETKLDPVALKQLHRFLQDGEWKVEDKTAEVRLKDVADRSVGFFKIDDRWFMLSEYRRDKGK
jgi:hypothetical protein